MNETQKVQRLTNAIADLARVLVELTETTVREQRSFPSVQNAPSAPIKSADRLMTKKDVAAHLKVSLRTVDNLLNNHRLPYMRLSPRCVRFRLSDVDAELQRRCGIGGIRA